jgi:hypothetical protein
MPSQRTSPAAIATGSENAGRGPAAPRAGRLVADREAILDLLHALDA